MFASVNYIALTSHQTNSRTDRQIYYDNTRSCNSMTRLFQLSLSYRWHTCVVDRQAVRGGNDVTATRITGQSANGVLCE